MTSSIVSEAPSDAYEILSYPLSMQGLCGVVVRYLNKLRNNQLKICNSLCFNPAFSGLLVCQMADYMLLKLT